MVDRAGVISLHAVAILYVFILFSFINQSTDVTFNESLLQ